jgi:hypothetical protein
VSGNNTVSIDVLDLKVKETKEIKLSVQIKRFYLEKLISLPDLKELFFPFSPSSFPNFF